MLLSKTVYRPATPDDYQAIKDYTQFVGYFLPVDPETLGGHWIVAESPDGRIVGTIWFFGEKPHAFVDYWSGKGKIAIRLLQYLEAMLRELGFEYARGAVWEPNTNATRILDVLGVSGAPKFLTVYKDIPNGRRKNDDNATDDTAGKRRAVDGNVASIGQTSSGC